MMGLFRASAPLLLLPFVLSFAWASTAMALSFHARTTGPSFFPTVGETFTIEIRLSGGVDLYGIAASAWGYEPTMFEFIGGEAVAAIHHAVCVPAVGCFNGLANQIAGASLVESAIGDDGPRVQFFDGQSCCPTNSNPLDPGLDGVVGGGDAQFRLTFRLLREGIGQIRIGTGYRGDGAVYAGGRVDQSDGAVIDVAIIPEPATATFLGLGLALLAAGAGRSSR